MRRTHLLLLLAIAVAFGAHKLYDIPPFRNYFGTQPLGRDGISQSFINVVDSLSVISLWVGDMTNGEEFHVEVRDEDDNVIATGNATPGQSWHWLDITLVPDEFNKPIRGKTYNATFTRPTTGEPISFSYCDTNPYTYGQIAVGGGGWNEPHPVEFCDLAMRCYGVNDTVTSDWWGANCNLYRLSTPHGEDALDKAADSIGLGWMRDDFTAWAFAEPIPPGTSWRLDEVEGKLDMFGDEMLNAMGLLCYGSWHDPSKSTKSTGTGKPGKYR
jgi:hypothetical protein